MLRLHDAKASCLHALTRLCDVGWTTRVNGAVELSFIGRMFQLKGRRTTFTTELQSGLVTFLAMAYILAVNAGILADSGGPCGDSDCTGPHTGQPNCRFIPEDPSNGLNEGYLLCVAQLRKSLISATAMASMVACLLMGLAANLPIALAPAMGVNAYFTYSVVGYAGSRTVTYQEALAAVFVEGLLFVAVTLVGFRIAIISMVPRGILFATSAGIGMFLAFIGLQTTQGIGAVAYDAATLVTVGGCPLSSRAYTYTVANVSDVCILHEDGKILPNLGVRSNAYACLSNEFQSPSLWLGIAGGFIMVVLMARRFTAAIMVGVLFVTFVSWIPATGAAYLGPTSQIPGGEERLQYFKQGVALPNLSMTWLQLDFSGFARGQVWVALLTMLYLDFLDCSGTLFSMTSFMARSLPGFMDAEGVFPRRLVAFCVDGVSISFGALLGVSPLTAYIESATGIREGARTGLASVTTAFCFFVALFFSPILASIPPYATGPALLLVGALMMEHVRDVRWHIVKESVPAFLTITAMSMMYSVAFGIIAGLASHFVIWGMLFLSDLVVHLVRGRGWRDAILLAWRQPSADDECSTTEEVGDGRTNVSHDWGIATSSGSAPAGEGTARLSVLSEHVAADVAYGQHGNQQVTGQPTRRMGLECNAVDDSAGDELARPVQEGGHL